MIKCPSCKTKLTPNAKFCFSCGKQMSEINLELDHDLEFLKRTLEPKFTQFEKIGQGGMGTIFLGVQVSLDRKVVIKLLNANLALDQKITENFLKEAQIAANLKHPNIVEMVDYGKAEDRPFFIMEYGEKGSLEKILLDYKNNHKKIPGLEVCRLMVKVLRALDFAHSKNLLAHRDIKPHNIILRDSGEVFISDFGVALDKKEKNKQSKEIVGTLDYMSPEQIKGEKDIDQKSDIYSFGILFFELLTNSLPFESIDKDKLMEMHLNSEIPNLEKRLNKHDLKLFRKEEIYLEQIQSIIRKACEKDKSKRFENCNAMADSIESIVKIIEEKKTVSYIKNRKLITIFSLLAGSLLIFIGYFGARKFVTETCKNCCIAGNCKNGTGKYVHDSKNIYEGEFKNGLSNGKGEHFVFTNKSKYEGTFVDGKYSGFGTLINFADKKLTDYMSRYSGEFKEGEPDGKGAYYFKDGTYFAGEFKNGKPISKNGVLYSKDNSLYKGEILFENGKMIPQGKGIILFADGRIYKGNILFGLPHGEGRMILSNGKIKSGLWENGNIVK